jgi:outer membrane protein TolC
MKAVALALLMAVAASKGKKPAPKPVSDPAPLDDDTPTASPAKNAGGAKVTPTLEASESYLSAAVGRPNGLKAAEVAARAVETSPQVAIRADELNGAQATTAQAVVGLFPRLGAGFKQARLSFVPDQSLGTVVVAPMSPDGLLLPGSVLANAPVTIASPRDQTAVQASLVVPVLDYLLKTPQNYRAAAFARDAAALQVSAAKLNVALDAKVAYYNWARAKLQVLVADQALLQAKAHRVSVSNLFDAGNASKADVLRVDAQVSQAELGVLRARSLEAVLAEHVKTLMHDQQVAMEIGEDLTAALEKSPALSTAQLLDEAKLRRVELQVLDKTYSALDAQAWAARGGYLPHVDGYASALYANPNPRYFPPQSDFHGTWEAGVQVSYSPNEVALAAAVTDEIKAKRSQVQHQREGFIDQLRVELAQAFEEVKESDLSVDATAKGLNAAEESYRVRKELFQNERSTSVELTDAEQNLTAARLSAITARIDQRISRARLEHARGEDVSR